MSQNELKRMTIFDLLGMNFVIPSYQRGYRWKEPQVAALLDHILEFSKKGKEGEFYCLQPIVVKEINKNSDGTSSWEVIDGQQRLTTIYIILRYFMEKHYKSSSLIEYCKKEIFSIEYETRPESKKFLEDISSNETTHNIDFHHMRDTYNKVSSWIDKNLPLYENKVDFIRVLLDSGTESKKISVQVIWYKVEDAENSNLSYDLFTRLNIGKISLTNAELIKALFLKKWDADESDSTDKKYFNLHQLQIASEWDMIEKTLQNNSFWYFISNSTSYVTRIEYIFDLMVGNTNHKKDREQRYTFNEFYKKVKSENDVDEKWKEIKKQFSQFETWYHDKELYHLIGFIIATGISSIDKISKEQLEKTKINFKCWLKDTITIAITSDKTIVSQKKLPDEIRELKYGGKDVSKVLLLFNIVTIIKNDKSNMKFPFDLYKEENWDIEHIHSQITKERFSKTEITAWLEMFDDFFKLEKTPDGIQQEIINEMKKIKSSEKNNEEAFKNLFDKIEKYLKIDELDENNTNRLGNLAILDSSTNRSYQNAWFPFKRNIILKKDSTGTFVPIATKNVFMKAYSPSLTSTLKWEESDMDSYEDEIVDTLSNYFNGDKNEK